LGNTIQWEYGIDVPAYIGVDVNCSDCNKQIDPMISDEPVVCFLVGERMEYTCEDCSEGRQQVEQED